ncbi:hypothetical protein [Pseudoclavibacter helvolus]|uniref:hypothetical protein n=1 Tax=Pseudoclavibacter helvolus TaxID=255205 RepID=UPI003735F234
MSYVDSPLHGAAQVLLIVAIVVLALRARKLMRMRAAHKAALTERDVMHTSPIGEPVEFRPGTWMVRLSDSEAVFGRSRDEAMARAFRPRKIGALA